MGNDRRLTPAQIKAFWRAFAAARAAVVPRDAETWRRKILFEETGKASLRELDRTGDFERVMHRLWSEAGDWEEAARFCTGDADRLGFLIKTCAAQIMQLAGRDESDARRYLEGVLAQSRIVHGTYTASGEFWMDVPLASAAKVFQMLDTHRRRLLREAAPKMAAAFSPKVRYVVDGPIVIRQGVSTQFYADEPLRVEVRKDLAA